MKSNSAVMVSNSYWRKVSGFLLTAMLAMFSASVSAEVDLVVLNADVRTVNQAANRAQAFAVQQGKFVAVGSDQQIKKWIGSKTKVIDAKGKTVVPGLVDGHTHLHMGIDLIRGVDLYSLNKKTQWLSAIAERDKTLPDGAWLLGGRWDYTRDEKGVLPTKQDIDAVVSDRPVFLVDIDYHSAWANSKALELAGITKNTQAPEGGEIVLDPATGEPTGVLTETAMSLVIGSAAFAENSKNLAMALRNTVQYVNSKGLTSVQDMASVNAIYDFLTLQEQGQLTLRVWFGAYGLWGESKSVAEEISQFNTVKAELSQRQQSPAVAKQTAMAGPLLEFGYIKAVYDGVLSIYTAALKAPYSDKPDVKGTPILNQTTMSSVVEEANRNGYAVSVHAIGDESVSQTLSAFARVKDSSQYRNRIEHIEVVDPVDIARFKDNNVTASMQPNHGVLGDYVLERIGKKREPHAYAWKTMLEQGVHLVLGSDWPTATLDPLTQLADAVLRQRHGVRWQGHNALSFDEALYAYTQAGADMAGWGDQIGSITKGKWADFVMLDGRLPEPLDNSIRERVVAKTFLSGKQVFAKQ